jgi:acyl-CoA dehydrogenase
MSITETPPEARAPGATHPTPVRPDDDRFVSLAAEVGAVAAAHADEHDRDATFVSEAYDTMRANGYLRLAVPEDLGGLGASIRQVCYAQAELARHDGAGGDDAPVPHAHAGVSPTQGSGRLGGRPPSGGRRGAGHRHQRRI